MPGIKVSLMLPEKLRSMVINIFHKKDLTIICIIYLTVLIKSIYSARLGFDLLDEGEYLHIGLRILQGQIPYGDFFSYLPPLYDYWNVLAFKLFGVSAFSVRLLNSIIFSFVPVLFYLIARRFSSSLIALLISLSFGFMELGMERLYYHVLTFGSLYYYFTFLRGKKAGYGFLAGLLLGLAALFRLDVALQFLLGLTIATVLFCLNCFNKSVIKSVKLITIIGIGFLIPLSGFVYWLFVHNLFDLFIQVSITTPTNFAAAQEFPFPKPWNILPQSLSPKDLFNSYEAFFVYLIMLVYLAGFYYLIKHWRYVWKKAPELPTFLLIAIFTTPYIFSRPDLGHMIKGGIPAFFIAAFILEKMRSKLKNSLLLIPIILIGVGILQIIWWTNFYDVTIQTPNGIIKTNSKAIKDTGMVSADTIRKSLDFISKNSVQDEQILIVPYMSGLYFLADRPSKLYVGNIYFGYIPDEKQFIQQLKLTNPKVIVYNHSYKPRGYVKSLHEFYPKIDQFIMENFKVMEQSPEGWLFMVRK